MHDRLYPFAKRQERGNQKSCNVQRKKNLNEYSSTLIIYQRMEREKEVTAPWGIGRLPGRLSLL